MTKNNTNKDMDDLIISINDIDVDVNISEDIYNNMNLYKSTEKDLVKDCANYTIDLLNYNNDKKFDDDSLSLLEEGVSEKESEIPHRFINNNTEKDILIDEDLRDEKVETSDNFTSSECDEVIPEIKSKKKNKVVAIAVASILIGAGGTFTYKTYKEFKAEQLRLSELDKENLDLKLIIDTVDEYGGMDYQLNWKEIASVLSVQANNHPELITKTDILNVCSLFLNKENGTIANLDAVVKKLDMKSKQKSRIFDYYDDLAEFGYTPEKLKMESPQMLFINSIKEGAIESYRKTKILPSITIAQAILESNWGESNLAKESNNLFGIKADSSWKGEYVIFETKEFHNTMIKDKFRKYDSVSDAIMDHSEFLRTHSRYEQGGVFEAKTYKAQALALQESGYSTAQDEYGNKTYASMLEQLIRQYNLQILDWEVKYFDNN